MLVVKVKVVPASGRLCAILDKSAQLKIYLKSAPEDGKANKELIKFLAQACDVTQREVEIVSGLTYAQKILHIQSSLTYEQLLQKLGILCTQQKMFEQK